VAVRATECPLQGGPCNVKVLSEDPQRADCMSVFTGMVVNEDTTIMIIDAKFSVGVMKGRATGRNLASGRL
jgi:hypothetical protein